MPPFGPIKRKDLITNFLALGFDAPVWGGDLQYMRGRGQKVRTPDPHGEDINRGLLARILRQAGVDRSEWEAL